MIASIKGELTAVDGDRVVIQTEAGLGYELLVPRNVLETLPTAGGVTELTTVLVVREDSLTLYGFASQRDRVIFQRLLGTSGVGPRLALALLSSLGTHRLVRSLCERDIAALTTVPGIGKKTAERLSLEMADRLKDLALDDEDATPELSESRVAVDALVRLGYTRSQAEAALRTVIAEGGPTDVQHLIRQSLHHLGAG